MSAEFPAYLKRISLYQENKIHLLQSAVLKWFTVNAGAQDRANLIHNISATTNSSVEHAKSVVNDMSCLYSDNGSETELKFNPAVVRATGTGEFPLLCQKCKFGKLGEVRSGCSILLDKYYKQRTDIRLTSYDDELGIATHYSMEQNKDARDLAMSLTPIVQSSILEHVNKTKFKEDDDLWVDTLANYLHPLMVKDLGKDLQKLGLIYGKNYDSLSNLRTILRSKYNSVPSDLKSSPWFPVIREFGIFNVLDDFIQKIYFRLNKTKRGFSNSEEILNYYQDYFYPPNLKGKKIERGDIFRKDHVVRYKNKPLHVDVVCPGRAVGSAISLCVLFNLDLKKKEIFTPTNNFVRLVQFDKQDSPHLQYPNQMKQEYDDLIKISNSI
jgi:hypothetical protein